MPKEHYNITALRDGMTPDLNNMLGGLRSQDCSGIAMRMMNVEMLE